MNLSLKEKIGQMLFVGINDYNVTDILIKLVSDHYVGGIILYKRNYKDYKDMLNLVNKLKQANKNNKIPLFIGIDQEGGRVNRLPSDIKNIPSAITFSRKNDIELLDNSIDNISKVLNESGINLNFAPVLDIKRFDDNTSLGDRCYGENAKDVIKYGVRVMGKYKENNIISVIKHFPGSGISNIDSHYFLPKIKSIDNFKEDIIPFVYAMNNGSDMMMISHIKILDIDKRYPISFSSKFINEYIKEKYNYKGLLITDDIKMRSISYRYTKNKILTNIINSGINMIMFKYRQGDDKKIINKIEILVKNKKIDIDKINNSVDKIISLKKKYNINDNVIN